jgi:uncharacterized Rossmann fold enzyme
MNAEREYAPVLGYKRGGADSAIVPLELNIELCVTNDNLKKNLGVTLSRPYVRFNEFVNTESGKVSICGFGPSLVNTYAGITGDIAACNGAHNYLIERGIIPKFGVFFDADERMEQFVTPHKGVTYLVASRCHQSVFDKLEGHKVIVWHVKGDNGIIDEMLEERGIMEPMVHGGTAGVTRTMFLMHAMGYRELHLHGADSSYEGEHTHVKKSIVPETSIEVWAAGKWFKTTPWLCGQVEDIKILAPAMKEIGARLIVHGSGLFPHIAKVIGLEVVGETSTT